MWKINFGCRYCRRDSEVSPSRVMEAHFIRCDRCFAVNRLSESQRVAMIRGSDPLSETSGELQPREVRLVRC